MRLEMNSCRSRGHTNMLHWLYHADCIISGFLSSPALAVLNHYDAHCSFRVSKLRWPGTRLTLIGPERSSSSCYALFFLALAGSPSAFAPTELTSRLEKQATVETSKQGTATEGGSQGYARQPDLTY
jgi:hypothetical protein